ncbi:zinc finger MYM-type protein 3-like [Montipora capricornis]|uniref:zinc finger MYM-type protein 3-like n=1 Tax=Montipora capricornis TaxID=246305 RepID=UPI0035F18C3E
MSTDSLNFWLCKFICEVVKQTGERYPPETLYLLVCGINSHLGNVQGEKAFNIPEKSDRRFIVFRKKLDSEMKDPTKCGVAQASKMSGKEEITERKETILWDMALLGANTAESLLNTVYFYNGKLFGLRAGEHRLIRLSNIVVEGNKIVFDE